MKKGIIIDLDGTLADNDHRREHLEGEEENWEKYYDNIRDDGLNEWCRDIIDRFKDDHYIYIVTGREGTKSIRTDTKVWLAENNIYYDQLHFREEKDYRKDAEVKKEILYGDILGGNQHPDGVDHIKFAIDDRLQVIEMWRDLGITVLDCAGGEF